MTQKSKTCILPQIVYCGLNGIKLKGLKVFTSCTLFDLNYHSIWGIWLHQEQPMAINITKELRELLYTKTAAL